ncbi:hypothetical protein RA281_27675, partial [Pseudomonas syringae pv. tagetis]
ILCGLCLFVVWLWVWFGWVVLWVGVGFFVFSLFVVFLCFFGWWLVLFVVVGFVFGVGFCGLGFWWCVGVGVGGGEVVLVVLFWGVVVVVGLFGVGVRRGVAGVVSFVFVFCGVAVVAIGEAVLF